MPPRRGAEVHLNVAFPMDLADELDVFCKKRKVKKKKIVEFAVRRLLADMGEEDDPAQGPSQ